ncbi:hypothetical protein NLX83_39440 [Allokutzneria sp. A3M-2-11 16]|uniref:hypothetical protein n=1 Tax=Allokutzneria sp. A3M-2-11 16 TaxID=2962043 RepID=UPI0020B746AE|nr:hypothetical protein [Allokutzneria sp. A3M-2-11 16]MCP3805358.1 hypothetical protein [Allokutzneria sp. A3M-2-11 16]
MTSDHADEHHRYAQYLRALAAVHDQGETDLIAAVLRDPDATMAQSAVVKHLDDRAARLLLDERYDDWARSVITVIAEREFLSRRLREWGLLRAISLGRPWTAQEIIGASDWFQRRAAQTVASPEALTVLAERGRTRRVRAAALRNR